MIIAPGRLYIECDLVNFCVPYEYNRIRGYPQERPSNGDAAWMQGVAMISIPIPPDDFPGPMDVYEKFRRKDKMLLSVNIDDISDSQAHYLKSGMVAYVFHPAVVVDIIKEPRTYRTILGGTDGFQSPLGPSVKDVPAWYSYSICVPIGKIAIMKSHYIPNPEKRRLVDRFGPGGGGRYGDWDHASATVEEMTGLARLLNR